MRQLASFPRSNVRLQARAGRGASLCKPLFGGTCTRTAFSTKAANGPIPDIRVLVTG